MTENDNAVQVVTVQINTETIIRPISSIVPNLEHSPEIKISEDDAHAITRMLTEQNLLRIFSTDTVVSENLSRLMKNGFDYHIGTIKDLTKHIEVFSNATEYLEDYEKKIIMDYVLENNLNPLEVYTVKLNSN